MAKIDFHYKGIDKSGAVVEGHQEAENEMLLHKDLKAEGIVLLRAEPIEKFSFRSLLMKASTIGTVSMHEKIIVNRNLAAMLEAGLSMSRAISIIERQAKNTVLKKVLNNINEKVKKGSTLSEAMSDYPKVFSPLMVSMIASGEESGNIVKALSMVAEQMDKSYKLRKKVKGAMVYPAVIMFAMLVIGVFMMIYIVPTLTKTFVELGIDLPASTQFIIDTSEFVQNNLVTSIVGIIGFIFLLYILMKTRLGRRGRDWFFLHIPLISPLVKEINAARTTRTLSSLLTAGVPFVKALQITKEVVQNSYYQDIIAKAEKNIQVGLPISGVFKEADDLYPIFVSEMMVVGEETGELGSMLLKVATFYEDEVDQKTKNMSTIVEPFLMIIVGALVGFFAISMITPMYSLVETI